MQFEYLDELLPHFMEIGFLIFIWISELQLIKDIDVRQPNFQIARLENDK